jgi:hypothetical protein
LLLQIQKNQVSALVVNSIRQGPSPISIAAFVVLNGLDLLLLNVWQVDLPLMVLIKFNDMRDAIPHDHGAHASLEAILELALELHALVVSRVENHALPLAYVVFPLTLVVGMSLLVK